MAPLPPSSEILMLGGNEAALELNTIFAFAAILFASMQGVLCMESADPCRISYKKLQFLLGLEVLEVIVVVTSEALSFVDFRGALVHRLTWLRWVPTCLFILGLMELLLDLFFTLQCATLSRLYWRPFSSVGHIIDKKRFRASILLELLPLLLTASNSLVLVGWRQKWWMKAKAVSTKVAMAAAKKAAVLTMGAMVFCFCWGFILTGGLLVYFSYGFFQNKWHEQWVFMLKPHKYWERYPDRKFHHNTKTDETREENFKNLYRVQFGASALQNVTQYRKTRCLETAPLSAGNAVVGREQAEVFHAHSRFFHMLCLFSEHFTILPLQICVVIGLVQLYAKLDEETYAALKELVDAVIVVAMVEIAVGLKSLLWGCGGSFELHENDMKVSHPEKPSNLDETQGSVSESCIELCFTARIK